jgi:hypothetical protein
MKHGPLLITFLITSLSGDELPLKGGNSRVAMGDRSVMGLANDGKVFLMAACRSRVICSFSAAALGRK